MVQFEGPAFCFGDDINTDYIEGSLTLAEKTENTVVKAFVFKDLNNLEPIY